MKISFFQELKTHQVTHQERFKVSSALIGVALLIGWAGLEIYGSIAGYAPLTFTANVISQNISYLAIGLSVICSIAAAYVFCGKKECRSRDHSTIQVNSPNISEEQFSQVTSAIVEEEQIEPSSMPQEEEPGSLPSLPPISVSLAPPLLIEQEGEPDLQASIPIPILPGSLPSLPPISVSLAPPLPIEQEGEPDLQASIPIPILPESMPLPPIPTSVSAPLLDEEDANSSTSITIPMPKEIESESESESSQSSQYMLKK